MSSLHHLSSSCMRLCFAMFCHCTGLRFASFCIGWSPALHADAEGNAILEMDYICGSRLQNSSCSGFLSLKPAARSLLVQVNPLMMGVYWSGMIFFGLVLSDRSSNWGNNRVVRGRMDGTLCAHIIFLHNSFTFFSIL